VVQGLLLALLALQPLVLLLVLRLLLVLLLTLPPLLLLEELRAVHPMHLCTQSSRKRPKQQQRQNLRQ
jgi:hypothetical protein